MYILHVRIEHFKKYWHFFNIRSVHYSYRVHCTILGWPGHQARAAMVISGCYLSHIWVNYCFCWFAVLPMKCWAVFTDSVMHVQNTLQGFCAGLSFMQHYILPFLSASALAHCLYHLMCWNTETCLKFMYSIPICWIKFLQWLSWCWLIEMAPTLMKKM